MRDGLQYAPQTRCRRRIRRSQKRDAQAGRQAFRQARRHESLIRDERRDQIVRRIQRAICVVLDQRNGRSAQDPCDVLAALLRSSSLSRGCGSSA